MLVIHPGSAGAPEKIKISAGVASRASRSVYENKRGFIKTIFFLWNKKYRI